MNEKIIDVVGRCTYIMFNKGDFTIAAFSTPNGDISVKGNMFVVKGEEYEIKAELDTSNTKYENSYNAIQVKQNIDFENATEEVVRAFLSSFLTKNQTNEIIKTIPNPIEVIKEKDIPKLITVKGIGVATAERIIRNYDAQKDYSEAFIAFANFNMSDKMIKKICDHFDSVSIAVKTVLENPYSLTEVNGIGFTKADVIFLNAGNDPNDIRRIRAYTDHIFDTKFQDGHTWISPKDYVRLFNDQFYEGNYKDGVDYILENKDRYIIIDIDLPDGTKQKRLCLKSAVEMEIEVAKRIKELLEHESKMKLEDTEKIISDIEDAQGWEYSEEQREAIEEMLKSNVVMVQGLGGSGKSSTANAFLGVLQQNGYSYLGSALSGKAAANLTKTTGKRAETIHSTLKYGDDGKFYYNDKNKFPTNAFLLDELSMVNIEIFLAALRAIPLGAKLIMLGDFGQLEAIGVGVMAPFIRSGEVPMILLKKIHRQAQKSAIITHSISYRSGIVPSEVNMKEFGSPTVYGEMQDLEYIFFQEDGDIGMSVLKRFRDMLKKFDLNDIQILCSTKTTGAVSCAYLNERAQSIANPSDPSKPELTVGYKNNEYTIRLGDKVINSKNNRRTLSPKGEKRPIFNGNTGIVVAIDTEEESAIIDFDGIGEVVVTSSFLNDIELGYAITIHRSQGSTIECVILALPYHYLLNSKELLYTGMTRARKYQIIVTTPRSLKDATKKSNATKKNVNLDIFLSDYDKWKD